MTSTESTAPDGSPDPNPIPDLDHWDVVVIGAGPAGCAAALGALAAAPDASVLLLDRSDFPRDKACGDGIAPHALDVLAALGIDGLVDDFAPVDRLRLGFARGPVAEATMRRPVRVVPRRVLDARLVAATVGRGATLRRHRVRRVEVPGRAGSVVIDGRIPARCVVAADGANSAVRAAVGPRAAGNRGLAVAIRGYAPVDGPDARRQVITFGAGIWPSYAWSFPIGDGRANIGYGEALTDGAFTSRTRLLAGVDTLLPGAASGAVGWRAHHLPLSSARPRQPAGRVLLAGDALSLVNPLTGEGIYYAVLSGALAGQAAVTAVRSGRDPGTSYRTALRHALGRHFRHTTFAARLSRYPVVTAAGVRAAAGDARSFDALVELGLGHGLLTPRLLAGLARSAA